jgi:hypothetical protein
MSLEELQLVPFRFRLFLPTLILEMIKGITCCPEIIIHAKVELEPFLHALGEINKIRIPIPLLCSIFHNSGIGEPVLA